jgi:hypothetical protein
MSVDLFCYTSEPIGKAGEIIASLNVTNTELFQNKFSISTPRIVDENQKYIALEHEFSAESTFLVHLNDKNSAELVIDVSKKIKAAFGIKNILILHNNDQIF